MLLISGLAALVLTVATILLGGYVSASGAGLACPDWPTCNGVWFPDLNDPLVRAEWVHRLTAVLISVPLILTLILAVVWFRREPRLWIPATLAFVLYAAQVTLGMLAITSELEAAVVTAHLAIALATFASTLVLVIEAWRPPQRLAPRAPSSA